MRALLFHAPAYTADGYDDTRPRLVRAACKGSDNNVERRDIPENGLSVSDWYLRNILYIDARSHYCRSYIVNKTFSKYNSKSTNNFSFRNELNDIILQKLFRQGGSTFSYLLLPVLYPYRIDFHRF